MADTNKEQKFNCSSVDFNADLVLNDGNLDVKFKGRLDTVNATTLLALYRDVAAENEFKKISVDCAGTEYIASAGLRVLLMMFKAVGKENFSIKNINDDIREIMAVTGFDNIFEI